MLLFLLDCSVRVSAVTYELSERLQKFDCVCDERGGFHAKIAECIFQARHTLVHDNFVDRMQSQDVGPWLFLK